MKHHEPLIKYGAFTLYTWPIKLIHEELEKWPTISNFK